MIGPKPLGHWSSSVGRAVNARASYEHLEAGRRYRVLRAFDDFDGHHHAVGERWTFLGSAFSPHDDGLSLFVTLEGIHEWHIRLHAAEADAVANRLREFVGAA